MGIIWDYERKMEENEKELYKNNDKNAQTWNLFNNNADGRENGRNY